MSGRSGDRKRKAVRPEMVGDVEKEVEDEEERSVAEEEKQEMRGEELGVVEAPEDKKLD